MIKSFKNKNSFLSNFYNSKFFYKKIEYKTNEHAFQAAKTLNITEQKIIIEAKTPGKAKSLGKKVSLRTDWEKVKHSIMKDIILCKFNCNHELKQMLIDTGTQELIEGNMWHDNTWGDCQCYRCKNINGQNLLGKILMEVRNILIKKEKKNDNFS